MSTRTESQGGRRQGVRHQVFLQLEARKLDILEVSRVQGRGVKVCSLSSRGMPCVDTGRSGMRMTEPWESPEATGRVRELKRLWLLLLIPHKPPLVRAQGLFLSVSFLLNRVPLLCLQSPLPPSALQCHVLCKAFSLTSKQFNLWAASLLKGSFSLSHSDK